MTMGNEFLNVGQQQFSEELMCSYFIHIDQIALLTLAESATL